VIAIVAFRFHALKQGSESLYRVAPDEARVKVSEATDLDGDMRIGVSSEVIAWIVRRQLKVTGIRSEKQSVSERGDGVVVLETSKEESSECCASSEAGYTRILGSEIGRLWP
jgi:hypothetical protein